MLTGWWWLLTSPDVEIAKDRESVSKNNHTKIVFQPEYCSVCHWWLLWLDLTDILISLFNTSAEHVFKIHLKPVNICNTLKFHILWPAVEWPALELKWYRTVCPQTLTLPVNFWPTQSTVIIFGMYISQVKHFKSNVYLFVTLTLDAPCGISSIHMVSCGKRNSVFLNMKDSSEFVGVQSLAGSSFICMCLF